MKTKIIICLTLVFSFFQTGCGTLQAESCTNVSEFYNLTISQSDVSDSITWSPENTVFFGDGYIRIYFGITSFVVGSLDGGGSGNIITVENEIISAISSTEHWSGIIELEKVSSTISGSITTTVFNYSVNLESESLHLTYKGTVTADIQYNVCVPAET